MTVPILLVVTAILVVVLAESERQRAISGKVAAATMVTELFSASVSAGVVFGDSEAIQSVVQNLRQTDDVLGCVVFQGESTTPVGRFGEAAGSSTSSETEVLDDRIVVTRKILDNEGRRIGSVRVTFSLSRENLAFQRTRWVLAQAAGIVLVLTAALLTILARHHVVKPLMRLADTAKQIEKGNLNARAPEDGDREIATLARALNRMGDAVADRETLLKAELQVAADLQVSILPHEAQVVAGVEISAMMKPTTEVGGDYYDIIPTPDGCWLGIGDVSGHGLGSGVIMLMIQSAVAALVSGKPDITPVEVECAVNRVLYENIRHRMARRDHATLSILRYREDGSIRYAGAHEDLVVFRAATGTIDIFETPGTWVGAIRDVSRATVESSLQLGSGDVLVLYTDGVTEAMRDGVQFGFDRLLAAILASAPHGGARWVRDAVVHAVAEWTASPSDDVSIVVFRQLDAPKRAANLEEARVDGRIVEEQS